MSGFCNLLSRPFTDEATDSEDEIHNRILENPVSIKRFRQETGGKGGEGDVG